MKRKIVVPKKRSLSEIEGIPLPVVKCNICGNLTTQGLHQVRLKLIRKSYLKKNEFGKWLRVPPLMKREDVYMCTDCIARGKKWPGKKPT